MPEYRFRCDCGHTDSAFWPMSRAAELPQCEKCGAEMYRDYGGFNIGNKVYSKPLHSDALAISPDQVAEHRREFPDVEIDSECRPVFTNTNQHDSYLKKTGFNKKTQKIRKKKGKTIARMK